MPRSTATAYRASELRRLEKNLESTGSKLSSVVLKLDGVTSRLIQHAHTALNATRRRWPLAKGTLKSKADKLEQVLIGIRFTGHDSFMVAFHLDELNAQDARRAALDTQITEASKTFRTDIELLSTIPGVKTAIAQGIIAESGGETAAFPTSPSSRRGPASPLATTNPPSATSAPRPQTATSTTRPPSARPR